MLRCTQLVGFDWLNSAAAATATATATATGTAPTVTSVGTNSGTASASTITFTVPAGGIPANQVIIVVIGHTGSKSLISGSDTKGNTYAVGLENIYIPGGGNVAAVAMFSQNAAALVAGDIITGTFSSGNSNRTMIVAYASGLTSGSLLDKSSSADGTSTTPSSGFTVATTIASELALGYISFKESSTITEASGYTQIAGISVGSTIETHAAYKVLSTTATQSYAPTLSSSVDWTCLVQTLKT